jgi:hypothetical protein
MKKSFFYVALQFFVIMALMAGIGFTSSKIQASRRQNSVIRLSDSEIDGLLRMREEEKLARDVYRVFATKWGNNIFTKISRAEQKHMNSVGRLLKKYGITDPITNDTTGAFSNATFEDLFNTLVTKGNNSYLDALMIGALIEDMDINDLNSLLNETDKSNIKRVYKNLKRGSTNHLKAFTKQIEENGSEYIPEYISEEEYDDIISSNNKQRKNSKSRHRKKQGRGQGRGQGGGGGQNCKR